MKNFKINKLIPIMAPRPLMVHQNIVMNLQMVNNCRKTRILIKFSSQNLIIIIQNRWKTNNMNNNKNKAIFLKRNIRALFMIISLKNKISIIKKKNNKIL